MPMGDTAAARGDVEVTYDTAMGGVVVSLPQFITMAALEGLQERLASRVAAGVLDGARRLLVDTNQHDFESVACIRALRDALEGAGIGNGCWRVGFVAPAEHRASTVVSDREAYFNDVAAARAWLSKPR